MCFFWSSNCSCLHVYDFPRSSNDLARFSTLMSTLSLHLVLVMVSLLYLHSRALCACRVRIMGNDGRRRDDERRKCERLGENRVWMVWRHKPKFVMKYSSETCDNDGKCLKMIVRHLRRGLRKYSLLLLFREYGNVLQKNNRKLRLSVQFSSLNSSLLLNRITHNICIILFSFWLRKTKIIKKKDYNFDYLILNDRNFQKKRSYRSQRHLNRASNNPEVLVLKSRLVLI